MSPLVIRRTILAELAAYGSALTPDGILTVVRLKLPETDLADITAELSWLHGHELVSAINNPLDADDRRLRMWLITTRGESVLLKK